jgi:hypothetical protein
MKNSSLHGKRTKLLHETFNSVAKSFVIQEHTRGNEVHWDLMLELGDVLRTWRLDKAPGQIGTEPAAATRSFDHNLRFLTYQGPVNEGLGRVRIADEGKFEVLEESESQMHIDFRGNVLLGRFVLKNIQHDEWRFFRTI